MLVLQKPLLSALLRLFLVITNPSSQLCNIHFAITHPIPFTSFFPVLFIIFFFQFFVLFNRDISFSLLKLIFLTTFGIRSFPLPAYSSKLRLYLSDADMKVLSCIPNRQSLLYGCNPPRICPIFLSSAASVQTFLQFFYSCSTTHSITDFIQCRLIL